MATRSHPPTHLQDAGHLAAAVQHDKHRPRNGSQAQRVGHEQPDAGAAVHALVVCVVAQQLVAAVARQGWQAGVSTLWLSIATPQGMRAELPSQLAAQGAAPAGLAPGSCCCSREASSSSAHRRTELIMTSASVAMMPGRYCSQGSAARGGRLSVHCSASLGRREAVHCVLQRHFQHQTLLDLPPGTWEKGMCEEETATESTKNHQPAPKKAPANEGPHRRPCSRLRQ